MNEEYNLITTENIQGELIKNEIEQNNLKLQAFKEQKFNELLKENNQLKEQKKELRKWLEEHYDFSDCIRIKSVLDKLNELEGGKNE